MTELNTYKVEATAIIKNCFLNYADELKERTFTDVAEPLYVKMIMGADSLDQLHSVVSSLSDNNLYPFPHECTSDLSGLVQDLYSTLETSSTQIWYGEF